MPSPNPQFGSGSGNGSGGVSGGSGEGSAKHSGGEKACCVKSSSIESDGILSNLLARGLLSNILGASDQACATLSLIESLNLLGFSEKKDGSHSCTQTSAKCEGKNVCSPPLSSSPVDLIVVVLTGVCSVPLTRDSDSVR